MDEMVVMIGMMILMAMVRMVNVRERESDGVGCKTDASLLNARSLEDMENTGHRSNHRVEAIAVTITVSIIAISITKQYAE